jgi:hypothetical protein
MKLQADAVTIQQRQRTAAIKAIFILSSFHESDSDMVQVYK